jgi:hypothetical protein
MAKFGYLFTSGNGLFDPSEFARRAHYGASSAMVESLEMKKSASSSPTAAYNCESDDDDNDPWDREGWVPQTKSGEQKSPNTVSGK